MLEAPATERGRAANQNRQGNLSLEFDETPFLAPRQPRHLASRAFRLHHKIIGEIGADAVLGIVESGFNGKTHPGFENSVIAERKIRLLVAFTAFAMRR